MVNKLTVSSPVKGTQLTSTLNCSTLDIICEVNQHKGIYLLTWSIKQYKYEFITAREIQTNIVLVWSVDV